MGKRPTLTTTAGNHERDVRDFVVKFNTEQGNWDLVGNTTPVFFVHDPYKFPDFIHTQKPHPRTNLRSPTAMWDFWSLCRAFRQRSSSDISAIAARLISTRALVSQRA